MSRRIREYLESRFGASSLYTEESDTKHTCPIENRQLPYPVYLLLKGRECAVIRASAQMTPELKRRVSLLEQSGASIMQFTSSQVNLQRISDAFLVLIESGCAPTVFAEDASQPREYLDNPQAGEFVTPRLVMDESLIISVSTQDENPGEQNSARKIHAELAVQFESARYGAFVEFLGSLRPVVLDAIPTQRGRQRFFDTMIDRIPQDRSSTTPREGLKCCLGFANPDCSTECVFNMVRHGQIESAQRHALEQIEIEKSHYSSVTDAPVEYDG